MLGVGNGEAIECASALDRPKPLHGVWSMRLAAGAPYRGLLGQTLKARAIRQQPHVVKGRNS